MAMTNSPPPSPHDNEPGPTQYVSFILRCWQDGEARVRARLVDVNSGLSYPVSNLNQLPHLLWRLLHQTLFQPPTPETQDLADARKQSETTGIGSLEGTELKER